MDACPLLKSLPLIISNDAKLPVEVSIFVRTHDVIIQPAKCCSITIGIRAINKAIRVSLVKLRMGCKYGSPASDILCKLAVCTCPCHIGVLMDLNPQKHDTQYNRQIGN